MSIEWRPEVNALTTPQSYKILHVPRGTAGYEEMAADISGTHPNYTEDMIKSLSPLIMAWIQQRLINGEQVTFPDAFTFSVSFTGRLDNPDDPLPDDSQMLQVNVRASRPFIKEIRHQAKLERLPMSEKLPLIATAHDSLLDLKDVLNPEGTLQLTGSDLFFDRKQGGCGCVIEGTRSGQTVQTRLIKIENSEIMFLPDIPAQESPWNNEYTVSVNTRYSEHGTLRTGIYRRRLRTPLLVDDLDIEGGIGILTGTGNLPCAAITGGAVSANETLRISAILDVHEGHLFLNLIDMEEGGKEGAAVTVTANGIYTLNGFAGSAVTNLEITVSSFSELVDLVRDGYAGRLMDILKIQLA